MLAGNAELKATWIPRRLEDTVYLSLESDAAPPRLRVLYVLYDIPDDCKVSESSPRNTHLLLRVYI
jgi:hypothetical protein